MTEDLADMAITAGLPRRQKCRPKKVGKDQLDLFPAPAAPSKPSGNSTRAQRTVHERRHMLLGLPPAELAPSTASPTKEEHAFREDKHLTEPNPELARLIQSPPAWRTGQVRARAKPPAERACTTTISTPG
jgi:hypothetical protein